MEEIMIHYHLDHHFFEGKKVGCFTLTQVGRLFGNSHTHFAPHIHDYYYELTIVKKGKGSIITNSIPATVEAGDIYISLPTDIHEIFSSEEDPIEYDFFAFNSTDEFFINILSSISTKIIDPRNRIIRDSKIPRLVSYAIDELETEAQFNEMTLEDETILPIQALESICKLICTYLSRNISSMNNNEYDYRVNKAITICHKVMNFIDSNIFTLEKLEDLSQVTNYNYSYLSNLFKRTTGKTLREYYSDKRLFVARNLFDEKKLKGNEIAERLHYASYFSFSKAFKKKFGVSPQEYKKSIDAKKTIFEHP